MNLRQINNNIEKFINDKNIVSQTAHQIIKDFGLFGLQITFTGNIPDAYNELHSQLTAHLDSLTLNTDERLFALLYHIDVDERFFKSETTFVVESESVNSYLADLIIKRELTKVVLRIHFSNPETL